MRALVFAALVAAACSGLRWSGTAPAGSPGDELHPPPPAFAGPEIEAPPVAPSPRERRPRTEPLPEPSPLKLRTAQFPSDLGPDDIDVSGYPLQQRRNYRVYSRACARCHDFSRSLFAPHTSGAWLDFYVAHMRVRGRLAGRRLTPEEVKAVRDFLQYDAKVRKNAGKEFEEQLEQLTERFHRLMDERMESLQKNALPAPR